MSTNCHVMRSEILFGSSSCYVNRDLQMPDLRIAVPRFISTQVFRFIPGKAAFILRKKYPISLKP